MRYRDFAAKYMHAVQGGRQHREIIDGYNSVKPLPRGYKVSYTDSWCAAFATFVLDHCGAVNPPRECGVPQMWDKCKRSRRTVVSPQIDDLIFYDWDGDGVPDHVGIVYGVGPTYVLTIEGNKNKTVGSRVINKSSRQIYGYARIKRKTDDELAKVARDVIAGKYGNGDARRKKLSAAGYDPDAVQQNVNEILRK